MQSLTPEGALASALEEIAAIDREIDQAEASIKDLKKQRERLESIATEEMLTNKIEGVRVAGRSWRIEWAHSMSVVVDRREEVLDAARAEGWDKDLVQVNVLRLKSLLCERAREAGMDARQSFVEGTRFDGLVGEYVRPVLRHLTVG